MDYMSLKWIWICVVKWKTLGVSPWLLVFLFVQIVSTIENSIYIFVDADSLSAAVQPSYQPQTIVDSGVDNE